MPDHVAVEVDVHGYATVIPLEQKDRGRVALDLVRVAGKRVDTVHHHGRPGFRLPAADADAAGYIDKPKPKRGSRAKKTTDDDTAVQS